MSAVVEIPDATEEPTSVAINAVIKGKDAEGESWKEVADVISFSPTGAGLFLPRECKAGRLISLMLPLPPQMRCYDHDKEFYRVWGLVQHSHHSKTDELDGYHVGVAFIGKNAPSTYHDDPSRNYRICGMNGDGLWKVEPAKSEFKTRRDVRYWQAIDIYLSLVDKERKSLTGAKALTENLSKSGAAVFSSLDVGVGDRVKFISEQFDFSGLAVVCNRHEGKDGRMRLHLQFVDSLFPIENMKVLEAKE